MSKTRLCSSRSSNVAARASPRHTVHRQAGPNSSPPSSRTPPSTANASPRSQRGAFSVLLAILRGRPRPWPNFHPRGDLGDTAVPRRCPSQGLSSVAGMEMAPLLLLRARRDSNPYLWSGKREYRSSTTGAPLAASRRVDTQEPVHPRLGPPRARSSATRPARRTPRPEPFAGRGPCADRDPTMDHDRLPRRNGAHVDPTSTPCGR